MQLPFDVGTMLFLVLVSAFAAGVRGFAGFGAGMIFVPLASASIGPVAASVILWSVDLVTSVPMVRPVWKLARFRTILPMLAGYTPAVFLGAWYLRNGDPMAVRWLMSLFILAGVAALWSGWRYHGRRPLPLTLSVGAMSGFFGGVAQLSGPPLLVYWLSGSDGAAQIRANIIVLFFLSTFVTGMALAVNGVFAWPYVMAALLCAPVYFLAQYLGQRRFHGTSDAAFRRFAYILILIVAVVTLPAFDAIRP